MSSIVTAVFKATIGLLVNKGRDTAAEKLKDGDVTDQKFRGLIVREIDDIKSKLDGLSRKDLLASISFFKEGIELLYDVFDKARSRSEYGAEATQAACAEAFSVVKGARNVDLTGLDESGTRALSDAKERFKDARKEATRAFSNESLETSDRILAMQYRVMATILEKVDNPAEALTPCRVCIEELHALSAVQECFNVELTKGFRARFGKDERRENISNVCHVNFVTYDIAIMVWGFCCKELSNWPCIGSGEDKVDPLRDERLTKVLRKQGMERRMGHFCVTPWSFGPHGPHGPEGEQGHKDPLDPWCIATNSSGQFIVGDRGDSKVKVFDSSGTFIKLFSLPNDDADTELYVHDVATDMKDNIYVLVRLYLPGAGYQWAVYELNNTADLQHKFPVKEEDSRLTVTDSGKVLLLSRYNGVSVYEADGQLVREFGEDILKDAMDITAANDGRVMVVDSREPSVHIFSEHGDHPNKFKLQGCYSWPRIAFHRASEHVFVAGIEKDLLHVDVYTKDGEFIRGTHIQEKGIYYLRGITVTTEGRIAVVCVYQRGTNLPPKVLVI